MTEMKKIVIKLYEPGKISSGDAAKVLEISRLDFLELLSKYNVSILSDNNEDLKEDIANA